MDFFQITIDRFLRSVKSYGWSRTSHAYPSEWEQTIQNAVNLKRSGKYLDSASIYISLIERSKTVYSSIILYLYKVTACAGYLQEAFFLMDLGSSIYENDPNIILRIWVCHLHLRITLID